MKAFIGIGSNIGDKIKNCLRAIYMIDRMNGCSVIKRSAFYKTEPVGYRNQSWFVNCVIKIDTSYEPYKLLKKLQRIEYMMGRKRQIRWGPRIIDLDILLFEDIVIDTEELKIPHPLMHERRFVLVPMSQIEPDLVHPVLNKKIKEILELVPEEGQKVIKIRD